MRPYETRVPDEHHQRDLLTRFAAVRKQVRAAIPIEADNAPLPLPRGRAALSLAPA